MFSRRDGNCDQIGSGLVQCINTKDIRSIVENFSFPHHLTKPFVLKQPYPDQFRACCGSVGIWVAVCACAVQSANDMRNEVIKEVISPAYVL